MTHPEGKASRGQVFVCSGWVLATIAGRSTLITVFGIKQQNPKTHTYVLLVLLLEPDLPPMVGILLTMTEEPLGIRPSSSVYSRRRGRMKKMLKPFHCRKKFRNFTII